MSEFRMSLIDQAADVSRAAAIQYGHGVPGYFPTDASFAMYGPPTSFLDTESVVHEARMNIEENRSQPSPPAGIIDKFVELEDTSKLVSSK